MKEFKYVVTDPEGIHARPAGNLGESAEGDQKGVKITKGKKTGQAKRITRVQGSGGKNGKSD